jgi:hypothetical protein
MSNTLWRMSVLAAVLAGLAAVEPPARADGGRTELSLRSKYSGDPLVAGARRVGLSVTLDGKGGGSGTLTLDPNIRDGETSTQIAIREIPVQVRLVSDDAHAAKGRRLYELRGTGPEGKPDDGNGRWFLVRPVEGEAPCWLVFADKDGKFSDILVLE